MAGDFAELRRRFRADPASLIGQVPGVWPVRKPRGPTSHDLVDVYRQRLGIRQVGHGGTLDPMAEGLILILAGEATRLFDDLQTFDKEYRAGLRFGERTDTQDSTGRRIAVWTPAGLVEGDGPPPDPADPALRALCTRRQVEAALVPFRGDILQTPPMVSALKRGGRPLHALAREGKTVPREPRPVRVHALSLTAHDEIEAELEMAVSKGFYVRTLIDDLGLALGVGGVMTRLTRTRIGPFRLDDEAR